MNKIARYIPIFLPILFSILITFGCSITPESNTDFYALVIGISDYANLSSSSAIGRDLTYPVSDAIGIKNALIEQGWNESDITLLLDSSVLPEYRATKTNIIQNLNDIFSKADNHDFILVYYSGHGGVIQDNNGDESDGFDEFIVPYDYNPNDNSTLLLDDELGELFQNCPTEKGVIIFDSCNSGGFINKSIGLNGLKAKTLNTSSKNSGLNGDLDIRNFPVLTASSQDEFSWEIGGEISHGVFTYFILDGIDQGSADSNGDGLISIKEVFTYSRENTIELTYAYNIQVQHPQILFNRSFVDIFITR